MAIRRGTIWIDTGSKTRLTLVTSLLSPAPILAAIGPLTNAGQVSWWEGTLNTPSTGGVAALYSGAADFADLLYADAAGNVAKLTIPAPVAAMFQPDEVTVNPAAVAALNAVVIGGLITNAGNPVVAFLGGVRRRQGRDFP